ncbi:hypothetical protein JXQ70_12165 [bacterium]|nr:hypothetical protein [bacterium]
MKQIRQSYSDRKCPLKITRFQVMLFLLGLIMSGFWDVPRINTSAADPLSSDPAPTLRKTIVLTDCNSPQLTASGRYLAREIINILAEKNISCLNSSSLQRSHDEFFSLKSDKNISNAPQRLGQKYKAHFVIILETRVNANKLTPSSTKFSAQGTIEGNITQIATNTIIFSKTIHSQHHDHTQEHEAKQATLTELAQKFLADAIPVLLTSSP